MQTAIALMLLIVAIATAPASEIAMDFTGSSGNLFQANSTFGWSFEVHQPIRVDRLGFFDDFASHGPGIQFDHLVRIWTDDADRTLLTGATVTNSSQVEPTTADNGQWLVEPISPIVLRRGEYVIGADDPGCTSGTCDRIRFLTTTTSIPQISFGMVRNSGTPGFPQATGIGRDAGYFGPTFWATALPGPDLNLDDRVSCVDVDALVAAIAGGDSNPAYDMTGDGNVDQQDLTEWLFQAGERNLGPGKSYLVGDANLDGSVDGQDFVTWNTNKFTATPAWCSGDFDANGFVDGQDFVGWNTNKFTSADGQTIAIPEPTAAILASICLLFVGGRRQNPAW